LATIVLWRLSKPYDVWEASETSFTDLSTLCAWEGRSGIPGKLLGKTPHQGKCMNMITFNNKYNSPA